MPHYPDLPGLNGDKLDRAIEHIAKALSRGDAEFLFGAGMSAASGVPQGKALALELLDHFFPSKATRPPKEELEILTTQYPFEALVQGVQVGLDDSRERLTEALKAVIKDDIRKPSEEHRLFHQLCRWDGEQTVHRVFTTNFDTLIERQLDALAESVSEDNVGDIRRIRKAKKIPVIHLHGLLAGEYEITEKDVLKEHFRVVANELRAALISADAFVFVGYSMSDPDFRRLYQLYRDDITLRGKASKKTYVVMPPATPTSYRLGDVLWDSRSAVWIPLTAQAFFEKLKEAMEGHALDAIRKEICAKHSLPNTDDAFEAKVSQTMDALDMEKHDAIAFLLEMPSRSGA